MSLSRLVLPHARLVDSRLAFAAHVLNRQLRDPGTARAHDAGTVILSRSPCNMTALNGWLHDTQPRAADLALPDRIPAFYGSDQTQVASHRRRYPSSSWLTQDCYRSSHELRLCISLRTLAALLVVAVD